MEGLDYGLRMMGVAVILKAVEDYRSLIARHNKLVNKPKSDSKKISIYNNNMKMLEIENFFKSELFGFYCGEQYSGARVIDKIKKDAKYIECPIISNYDYKVLMARRYRDGGEEE